MKNNKKRKNTNNLRGLVYVHWWKRRESFMMAEEHDFIMKVRWHNSQKQNITHEKLYSTYRSGWTLKRVKIRVKNYKQMVIRIFHHNIHLGWIRGTFPIPWDSHICK